MSVEYVNDIVNKMYEHGSFDMEDAERTYKDWLGSKYQLQELFLNGEGKISFQFKGSIAKERIKKEIDSFVGGALAKNYAFDDVVAIDAKTLTREIEELIRHSANYEKCCWAKIVHDNKLKIESYVGSNDKAQKGMKITKAISRVFKNYGYELATKDFINQYSMLIQKSYHRDTLYISTKPEDILSISDNSNDWRSCMAPDSNETYKYGLIELANHPGVMVAYLKSRDDYKHGIDNKKWRALVFVGKNHKKQPTITIQKHYPYHSKSTEEALINYLSSQVGATVNEVPYTWRNNIKLNLSQAYKDKNVPYSFDSDSFHIDYNKNDNYYSCPICYNDSLCSCIEEMIVCDYCGQSVRSYDLNDTIDYGLVCEHCLHENFRYCEDCQELHPVNFSYETGYGDFICEDCLYLYDTCDYCGDLYVTQDLYEQQDGALVCPHC